MIVWSSSALAPAFLAARRLYRASRRIGARCGMRVLKEEAEHLPRSVRPSRIGEGPGGAAARPCMAGSMDNPLLEDRLSACIGVEGAAVSMPPGRPAVLHSCV